MLALFCRVCDPVDWESICLRWARQEQVSCWWGAPKSADILFFVCILSVTFLNICRAEGVMSLNPTYPEPTGHPSGSWHEWWSVKVGSHLILQGSSVE